MATIPAPANEEGRLRALRELKIVGTEPSSDFDALVQLACSIFDCPVALVSFIEKDYQWFKARQGLANVSTPRKLAFCNYTILSDEIFVVSDATRDKRFKHNSLVTGEPGIRFYAGCPISIDGENNIGTICIIDKRSRRLSKRQKDQLAQMGRAVEGLVKAHQNEVRAVEAAVVSMDQTRVAETRNRLLLQIEKFASIGAWQLDLETNTVMWSDEVFRLHDLPVGQMPSLDAALGFYPGAARDLVVNSIKQTIGSGAPFILETDFITAKGRMRRVRSMGELELKDGVPKKLFGVFEDVTHRYEVEQRLWKLAYVDPISSIANRAQFQQRFAAKLAEAEEKKTELSLFLLDLDRFKEVNDTMGHHAGDEVIKAVAERITAIAGPKAFCARLGGDEFAILANIRSAEGPQESRQSNPERLT